VTLIARWGTLRARWVTLELTSVWAGVKLDLPILMEKDKQDIMWGLHHGIDFLAVSFCQSAADVRFVREFLGQSAVTVKIIAKIENQQGVDEIDDIISEADGVMVARGDLGMEVFPLPPNTRNVVSLPPPPQHHTVSDTNTEW
jgi:pyruvate kinase